MVKRRSRARARRRSDERGATLLIVLTVIMILSAVGTYALSNARYEIRTAGYVKQRAIAAEVVQIAVQTASQELQAAPGAYVGKMRATSVTQEVCAANGGLGAGGPVSNLPPCYHIYAADIQNRMAQNGFSFPIFLDAVPGSGSSPGTPGSLGLSGLTGGFWVELTDPMNVVRPIPGAPIDGSPGTPTFIDVTVTGNGVVWQDEAGGTLHVVDANERGAATFVQGRGHVLVGPIYGVL